MEAPLLQFTKEDSIVAEADTISSTTSHDHKLVPWLSWNEWEFVKESLFSSSHEDIDNALNRISAWRGRGSLPVVVDVTSSIVEIHQMDPYFRGNQSSEVTHSEQMLAMLYSMAIVRLVNCVVEKTRKRSEISIADAADAIGLPRSLIDIRHEGSHRDLPALPVARDSSVKALNWLRDYYWEPQQKLIPFQRNRSAIQKEIKAKFRELAFCFKAKQHPQSVPSLVQGNHLGRNKFLSAKARKPRGYKKQIIGTVKTIVQLYSSFSSEVLSMLLEFLLKAAESSYSVSQGEKTHIDDWKVVITKLSNEEPELLLTLLSEILDMIKSQGATVFEMVEPFKGTQHHKSSDHRTKTGGIDQLSFLFSWLVGQLKGLKFFSRNYTAPTEVKASKILSNAILKELLRKCVLISGCSGNTQLMKSTLLVAELIGDDLLIDKLSKIFSIWMPNSDITENNTSIAISKDLTQHEESVRLAANKLESYKSFRIKSKVNTTTNSNWVVAKSWNPCPIGMLPRDLSYSGRLPVMGGESNHEIVENSSKRGKKWELNKCSGNEVDNLNMQLGKNWELNMCSGNDFEDANIQFVDDTNVGKLNGKRGVSYDDTEMLDSPTFKKRRETMDVEESNSEDGLLSEGIGGVLLIGGVYKKVRKEEPIDIRCEVSIWV
ncbi:hypothetical protein ACFE04_024404 [Oxalis oulophora]